ncbi:MULTISPECIES: hypothetical protein [unclassified Chryseobacterium]|uniref:hypothetical protein n=1 Tax=unclassified Chryseobacterium TaxID=2593645 RepID=UPI00301A1A24
MKVKTFRLKPITIKSIRDFILDHEINENQVIILNKYNFDDIVLEHLNFYKVSATFPYKIITVLIEEDPFDKIAINYVGVINDYDYDFNYDANLDNINRF